MIKPTVGRKVWFYPAAAAEKQPTGGFGPGMVRLSDQPMDATVLHVWSDRCVNLQVIDHAGRAHFVSSATLRQEGDPALKNSSYAEWMPYQTGQAKKEQHAAAPLPPQQFEVKADALEAEILVKADKAPRVTLADIEAAIVGCYYFTADQGVQGAHFERRGHIEGMSEAHEELRLLTFCILVLKNGFTVTGESACASPENFDAELGRKIARQDAINQCWPLLGYELRSKLAAQA